MKKRMLVFSVAAMMAITLAGCGSTKDEAKNNSAGSVSEMRAADITASDYVTLGEYKGLTVSLNAAEPTEEEIQNRIDSDLQGQAEEKEITGRAVQNGDIVNIDYVGKKDGVAFDGGTSGPGGYDLTIGSGSFIEGFEDGLIGANVGDTCDLNLTFPENYQSTELAGADVVFTVSVNSIKEKTVPELDDAVANKIDSTCNNVEEYKENVKTELINANKTTALANAKSELLRLACDNANAEEIPDWLLTQKIDYMKKSAESYATAYGISYADFLSNVLNETEEQFEEECKNYGAEDAKQTLVTYAIAQAEGLTISDEDYKTKLADYAKSYGYPSAEEFEKSQDMTAFSEYIQMNAVVDYLFDQANFVDQDGNAIDIDTYQADVNADAGK